VIRFLLFALTACSPSGPSADGVDAPLKAAAPHGERSEAATDGQSVPAGTAPTVVAAVEEVLIEGAALPASTAEPVPLVLVWEGISPLHKSFFSDSAAMEQLGRDLAGSVKSPANVHIAFDSHRHIGRILLRLLPNTGIDLVGETGISLDSVSPVLQALARYRDAVSGRYDTRIAAFRIGIDSYRGVTHCRFGAAGTLPPDGTVVDGCVLVNGRPECGLVTEAGQEFSEEMVGRLRECLK